MESSKDKGDPSDPLQEHREAFKLYMDAWNDDRSRYVEDLKFSAGHQWDERDLKDREDDGRPCLVVDKLNQYVKQVVNDSRQNRPGIKVRPVDSGADVETAEIFQGLIRHVEDRSNADIALDTALECAVKGGFGFFRILREYASEKNFNQEFRFKRIRNPLTVLFDPNCQEPDGSDAKRVYLWEDLTEEEFCAKWPNAEKVDWENIDEKSADWYAEKRVRIAECYWVEIEKVKTHLFADGSTATDEEVQQATKEGIAIPEILDTRDLEHRVVKWAKMSGKEYLDGPREEPGKWIPVFPVWGNETDIEGKLVHTGMINAAKDAQRLYNYARTATAERLSKPGVYVAADGQVQDYESDWDGSNRNVTIKRYTPTDINGTPVPPPRFDATDIPQSLVQDMQVSEHDIQGALGMYNASLGQQSNEKSGKAIMARQREGDMANFHYHDNLARAIRQAGRYLVDAMPKVYDTKRILRVLGIDGKAEMAQIDPEQPVAVQKIGGAKSVYNLGVGEYDVTVSVGPSYTTQRQEAADTMAQMFQGNPELMQVIGDLYFRNQDFPGAEDIADRLKIMLPPPIQEAEKAKGEANPEVQQMMMQVEQVMAQKDELMQGAVQKIEQLMQQLQQMQQDAQSKEGDIAIKAAELQIKQQELAIKEAEIRVKEYEAETKRIDVTAKAQNDQDRLQIDAMTAQSTPAPVEAKAPQEQQPINITIDGQRPIQKTARATRQPDGSYVMESIETPIEGITS